MKRLPLLFPLIFAACGDFGATPGGVQDLNYARDLIDRGQIPPPEAFKVEGMLAEHDLPLEGPTCETTLCLRGALGLSPDEMGEPGGWLQIGLSSTIEPEQFERKSVAVIATVDVSGSMGWDYSDEGGATPGMLSRQLLSKIAAQLGPADRIAIVTYGSSVDTVLDPIPGDRHDDAQEAIDDLEEDGSTNMEEGLEEAYTLAKTLRGQTDSVRIMLFTDAQPNVGLTDASEFERMVKAGADEGIGLTVFGLGLGLGADLMNAMAHVRGGNAYSMTTSEQVDALMEKSWPWMVSPIAYDLSLTIESSTGVEVEETYGFPARDAGAQLQLDVATVFLSQNRGALLVRFGGQQADLLGMRQAVSIDYRTPDGRSQHQTLDLAFGQIQLDESGAHYQQRAVHQTVALALLVRAMERSARLYLEDHVVEALRILDAGIARFGQDQGALMDPTFERERVMIEKLRALVAAKAPQGSLYGGN